MYQVLFIIFFFLSFIASSFAAPYAYVANEGDNTISVIDTQINQVVKVITSSNIKAPVSLALSKDKKTLFASYYQTAPYKGGYSKIDLSSGLVEVNASSKVLLPAALSLSPEGSDLYLTDNGVHDFYGFNVASSAISSFVNYTYESEVLSNLITLNGKKAYLPQGGYDVVTVIHLETNQIEQDINLPNNRFAAFSPAQSLIYTAVDGSFYIFSIRLNQIIRVINSSSIKSPNAIAIDKSGTLAFIANADNSVSVINLSSNKYQKTITDLSFNVPKYIAIAPNNQTAYVTNSLGSTVTAINIKTLSVETPPIQVGALPQAIVIDSPFDQPLGINSLLSSPVASFLKGIR